MNARTMAAWSFSITVFSLALGAGALGAHAQDRTAAFLEQTKTTASQGWGAVGVQLERRDPVRAPDGVQALSGHRSDEVLTIDHRFVHQQKVGAIVRGCVLISDRS